MDGGTLASIISGATILGGFIGWLGTQYWQRRAVKRQETRDASKTLKEGKTLLEEMIAKEQDPKTKQALRSQLEEVDAALLEEIRQAVEFFRSK